MKKQVKRIKQQTVKSYTPSIKIVIDDEKKASTNSALAKINEQINET